MKRKRVLMPLLLVLLLFALSTTAFAIDESEMESAIAASSREEVAGNVFIWFLCAIGFLKVSQKIDSFMASLGVNVGRTGGSMLAELLVAGRGIATAAGALGGTVFNRHSSHNTQGSSRAAGAAFTGGGNGIVSVTRRAAGNAAAASATGSGSGLSGLVGGAMFGSSLKNGGHFATSVIGAVAKGNISTVGSITGEKASEALSSYMGYSVAANEVNSDGGVSVPTAPTPAGDEVTLDGGTAAGVSPITVPTQGSSIGAAPSAPAHTAGVEQQRAASGGSTPVASTPPTFRDVEIGGGRITGHEVSADGQSDREFAMYSAEQYMPPTGPYDTVQTVDGASWYRQTMWSHQPLTDFWRVGRGYAKKLEAHGMFTMGDVARMSVCNEDLLYQLFGKNAELLIDHSWGWEPCTIQAVKAYHPSENSLGSGQVLHCPYSAERARLVLREMAEQLALDLVSKKLMTDQIVLTVGYDIENLTDPARRNRYHGPIVKDHYGREVPKHAHGTERLNDYTSSTKKIMGAATALFDRIVNTDLMVRRLNIVAGRVISESEAMTREGEFEQMDLFTDYAAVEARRKQEQAELDRERKMQKVMLTIKKMVPIRTMNYRRIDRTVAGHIRPIRYICTLSL